MEKSPKRGLRLANESVAIHRNQALIRASSTKEVLGFSFPEHIHFLPSRGAFPPVPFRKLDGMAVVGALMERTGWSGTTKHFVCPTTPSAAPKGGLRRFFLNAAATPSCARRGVLAMTHYR